MKELSDWKHADNYFVYFHNTILTSLAIFSLKSQILPGFPESNISGRQIGHMRINQKKKYGTN